jgi:chromosome segregation ATPase
MLNELYDKFPLLESSISEMLERLVIAETKLEGHDSSLNQLLKLINEKADKSIMKEFEAIHESIYDIHKDIDQFKTLRQDIDANKKICEALERTLHVVEERIDMVKDSLNERLRDLENVLLSLREELEKLDHESDRQGGLIIQINQRIDTLEIKLDNLDKMMSGGLLAGDFKSQPTIDLSEVTELRKQLSSLKGDFLSNKEEVRIRLDKIEEQLKNLLEKLSEVY